jgi:hypothetical protein
MFHQSAGTSRRRAALCHNSMKRAADYAAAEKSDATRKIGTAVERKTTARDRKDPEKKSRDSGGLARPRPAADRFPRSTYATWSAASKSS